MIREQLNLNDIIYFSDNVTKSIPNSQVPVVAKVLTNAAGQVISVESLLAHQKAHGTLPQGLPFF